MPVSLLLFASTLLLGYGVSRRFLGAQRVWEALSLAPLIACLLIIGGANSWGPVTGRWPTIMLSTLLSFLLLVPWSDLRRKLRKAPASESSPPALGDDSPSDPPQAARSAWNPSRLWLATLGLLVVCVVGYVVYAQAFLLDTDNWIHEPLIAGYSLGIFPPVHPFFPKVEMHGHYGRDLLIGTLLPRGWDPLIPVWWLNPLLAISACGVLLAIFRRWGDTASSTLAALAMPFFGACVGFRIGLADCFDGNNGLVYVLAILLFYVMLRVFDLLPTERPGHPLGLGCVAGYLLGVYQLVYETHFGLFLLTGLVLLPPAVMASKDKKRMLTSVSVTILVALLLACTEGGPITDLVRSKRAAATATATPQSDTNKGQHVSMRFPKENLFCVLATAAEYTRISPGFRLAPFRGLTPSIEGEGYVNIFSPALLATHWLPVFLAPFTLAWVLRRRHWPGLAFWAFGAWAYLVPGLIDFGPVYEWEYFRWEFAAGFALAVPLGLLCGSLIDTPGWGRFRKTEDGAVEITVTRQTALVLLGWLLLALALWPGEKLVNKAIIEVQKRGWPSFHVDDWRAARPELGVGPADLRAAHRLAQQILPGEVVMTNLGSESPLGLWVDCVVSALTGARVAGRAHPPEGRRLHAHPNYHRSSVEKALRASGRPDLLWNSSTSWLFLDPGDTALDEALGKSPHALLEARESDPDGRTRELWRLDPPPNLAVERLPSQPPFRTQSVFLDGDKPRALDTLASQEWRCGQSYRLRVSAFNGQPESARLGWLRIRVLDELGAEATDPLFYLLGVNPLPSMSGDVQDVVFVTPIVEGRFTVVGELMTSAEAGDKVFEIPLNLSLQKRLEGLVAALETPGDVAPKSFVPLRLTLTSGHAIESQGELELLTRIRQVDADYVWELDRVSTPLLLRLDQAGTQGLRWNITAPWREGTYDLELEILDKTTGARVPLKLPSARITVVEGRG